MRVCVYVWNICVWILWVGNWILVSAGTAVIWLNRKDKSLMRNTANVPVCLFGPWLSSADPGRKSSPSALLAGRWSWYWPRLRMMPGPYSPAFTACLDPSLLFANHSKKTLPPHGCCRRGRASRWNRKTSKNWSLFLPWSLAWGPQGPCCSSVGFGAPFP